MKVTSIALVFFASIFSLKAQDWRQMIQSEESNLQDALKSFNEEILTKGMPDKANGRNDFKRFYQHRLRYSDQQGNYIPPTLTKQQYKDFKKRYAAKRNANWQRMGPFQLDIAAGSGGAPGTTRTHAILEDPNDPNTLYVGTAGAGLWKTTDLGQNWQPLTDDEPVSFVGAIAIPKQNSSIVYCGSNGLGLLKSTDGGANWQVTPLSSFNYSSVNVRDLRISPDNPNLILAGCDNGLFRSTDAGASWQQIFGDPCTELDFHPTNSSIVYAIRKLSGVPQFYKSTNGGQSFTHITSGVPNTSAGLMRAEICVTPYVPDNVYMLLAGQNNGGNGLVGIYISNDSGGSFSFRCCGSGSGGPASTSNPNLLGYSDDGSSDGGQYTYDLGIAVSHNGNNHIYVGGILLWHSSDYGYNFSSYGKWYMDAAHKAKGYLHADIQDVYATANRLYVVSDGGVAYSENEGQSFTNITDGIVGTEFWGSMGFDRKDTNIMLGGTMHNGTLYQHSATTNGKWRHPLGGDNQMGAVDVNGYMWASDGGGGFRVSKDQGATWVKSNEFFNWENDPTHSQILYAVGRDGSTSQGAIWKSGDAGNSWTKTTSAAYTQNYNYLQGQVAISKSNSGTVICAHNNSTQLKKTSDGGRTWTTLSNPSGSASIRDIEIHPENADIVYLTISGLKNGGNLYRSTDGGMTWSDFSQGLGSVNATVVRTHAGTDGGVYLGTTDGIYYRNNSHSQWQTFNSGLPLKTEISGLSIHYMTNQVFIGTFGRGAWKTSCYETPSGPLAGFASNKRVINAGESVQFFDNSFYKGYSPEFTWTFEGAGSSSQENPSATYSNPGVYDVTLTVKDESGKSSTRTFPDMITVGSSVQLYEVAGNSMVFDGSDFIPTNSPLNFTTTDFTASMWIKPTSGLPAYTGIFGHRGTSSQNMGMMLTKNYQLGYNWQSENWGWMSGLTVPADEWSFVAMVVESGKATLYVNQQKAENITAHSAINFSETLLLGKENTLLFKGEMDEIKIWKKALSEDEIMQQMHLTLESSETDVVAYYQFNNHQTPGVDFFNGQHTTVPSAIYADHSTLPASAGASTTFTHDVFKQQFGQQMGSGIKFNETSGDRWTAHHLHYAPNTLQGVPADEILVNDGYWVFTSHETINPEKTLYFTVDEQSGLGESDQFYLYHRSKTSDGEWTRIHSEGVFSDQEVSFEGVQEQGQFLVTGAPLLTGNESVQSFSFRHHAQFNRLSVVLPKIGDYRYQIINMEGKVVAHGSNYGLEQLEILYNPLPAGMYMLNINGESSFTSKFVIR